MLERIGELDVRERSPATAHTAMLEALVAGEGLERVAEIAAEHVGAPVEIFVPRPGTEGTDGSPAERYVAELVAGGDPRRPAEATDVVPIVCADRLQGAVVMLGEGGAGAGEYLRVAGVAALTGIAMLNARDETARSLSPSFIDDLINRRGARVDDILRRAGLLGRDLSEGLVALCLEPLDCPAPTLVATLRAEHPEALVETVGKRVYLDPHLLPLVRGKRVVLVDDAVSSGSTLGAPWTLIESLGAQVLACGVAMRQGRRWVRTLGPERAARLIGVFDSPLLQAVDGGWDLRD